MRLGDRYRPIKALGTSRVNPTFLAVDERHSAKLPCIIKPFRVQSRHGDRGTFDREISKLYRRGAHPQLPQLLAYFDRDDRHYLVWEFIAGENLAEQVKTAAYFSETRVRELAIALLPILNILHREHLIHRNIKPENIIDRHDKLILVGFGSAKHATKTNLAKTGTVVGSAEYTAPEQLQGKTTFASDLYSLGVVCLHLLTGCSPFDLFDAIEGRWQWRDYLPQPVSEEFARIIDKAIAFPLRQRYPSASAFLEAIDPKLLIALKTKSTPPKKVFRSQIWQRDRSFSPDVGIINKIAFLGAKTLAIAAENRIYFWNLQSYDLQPFADLKIDILSCTASSDGNILANGNEDGSLDIWQRGGKKIGTLQGHRHAVEALALDEKGKRLVSGSRDRTVKLWNLPTGKEIRTFPEAEAAISAVALNCQTNLVASGDRAGNIDIRYVDTGEWVRNLKISNDAIVALALTGEGEILISSHWNRTVNIWDLEVGCLLYSLDDLVLPASSIAILPDDRSFVIGSYDGTLQVFDLETGELQQELGDRTEGIATIAICSDGKSIASCTQKGAIEIWHSVSFNSTVE